VSESADLLIELFERELAKERRVEVFGRGRGEGRVGLDDADDGVSIRASVLVGEKRILQ
jgi:hypothetical protein